MTAPVGNNPFSYEAMTAVQGANINTSYGGGSKGIDAGRVYGGGGSAEYQQGMFAAANAWNDKNEWCQGTNNPVDANGKACKWWIG